MITPYYADDSVTLWHGDSLAVLRELPDQSVDCCVTSPPYFGLRDYGVKGQYGLEASPAEYVETMRALFAEVRRVLTDDGTLWLNLGDSYYSGRGASTGVDEKNPARRFGVRSVDKGGADWAKPKNLLGIPWRVAFALQDDGWILRNDIIWAKPNGMPESVTDRLSTKHEHVFMFSKKKRYWFDLDPIREPHAKSGRNRLVVDKSQEGIGSPQTIHFDGKNPGDVWNIATKPFSGAHFAVMPLTLASRAIQAGCKPTRGCDCEEVILSPNNSGERSVDPSMVTGRRGMDRPRRDSEGARSITRRQQRSDAHQLRLSQHRAEIEVEVGAAFSHYIRTDLSGARPLPEHYRASFIERGWLVESEPCDHIKTSPGVVLDPFSGSGTTGLAAANHGRRYVGIDLSAEYLDLSLRTRLAQTVDLGETTA